MKERGIIMDTDEVRAILDGRKTQFRRKVSDKHIPFIEGMAANFLDGRWDERPFPYGKPGDRLWVREAFHIPGGYLDECLIDEIRSGISTLKGLGVTYRADAPRLKPCDGGWQPSSRMPRWASRITLEITGVRVERVQKITKQDAIAEGARYFPDLPHSHPFHPLGLECRWSMRNPETTAECLGTARHAFANSWVKRYGKSQFDIRPWDENPWVWVIEFKTVEVKS